MFAAIVGVLTGCFSAQEVHVSDTNPKGWSSDDPVWVAFDNDDTLSVHNLYLITRFEQDYSYDRLGVVIATTTPDGFIWRDTVYVGSFTERPRQGLYVERRQLWRVNSSFPQSGRYLFTFSPLYPDPVKGVAAVGLEVQ